MVKYHLISEVDIPIFNDTWFENLSKRQIKASKIYIRDSGILHTLLHLSSLAELQGHPKLGASWEGFALGQTLNLLETRDAYYWGTYSS